MKKIVLYMWAPYLVTGYLVVGYFECGIHDKMQVVYKELTGGESFKVTDNEFD